MGIKIDTPLWLTEQTMQNIVRTGRIHLPQESCGFIVADVDDPTIGVRMHWLQNVAEHPDREFLMSDEDVTEAYAAFDEVGEEPIAVWHTHPNSEPFMSEKDKAKAVDDSLAYMIVSFMDNKPSVRAYRVQHYIGSTLPSRVDILIQPDAKLDAAALPPGPWALTAGNYVRISYVRTGKTTLSHCVARVTGCDGEVVRLDPDHKTAARMIPLERIRLVHVIREGNPAAAARRQLRSYAGQVRSTMAGHEVGPLPELLAALVKGFPTDMAVTMEAPK